MFHNLLNGSASDGISQDKNVTWSLCVMSGATIHVPDMAAVGECSHVADTFKHDSRPASEALGFIIDFLEFNWDFLGFPILLLGCPRISIRISIRVLAGF